MWKYKLEFDSQASRKKGTWNSISRDASAITWATAFPDEQIAKFVNQSPCRNSGSFLFYRLLLIGPHTT